MLLLTVTDTALRFICATRKLYTKRSVRSLNETGVALNELYQLGFCSRLWWPGRRLFFCVTCGSCVSVSLRSSSGRCGQRVLQQPDWTAGNRAACLESMWNPLHRQHARWDLDNSDWTCASNPFFVPYPLCIKITLLRTGKMWWLFSRLGILPAPPSPIQTYLFCCQLWPPPPVAFQLLSATLNDNVCIFSGMVCVCAHDSMNVGEL